MGSRSTSSGLIFKGVLTFLIAFPSAFTNIVAVDGPQATRDSNQKEELAPVRIHGWFMYFSIGLLLPTGILVVRFMNAIRKQSGEGTRKRLQIFYYLHLSIQTTGIALFTGGAIYTFRKFGYSFNHTHQKLGVSLFSVLWLQFVMGFLRPNRGLRMRPIWYGIHWLLGTSAIILGFINIFIGINLYESLCKGSLRTVNIIFSVQISLMAVLYLMQDRWSYLIEQGTMSKPLVPRPEKRISAVYSQVPTMMEYQMRHYLPS